MPAPSDQYSGGGGSPGDSPKLSQVPPARAGLFSGGLVRELAGLSDKLGPVVRAWLRTRPASKARDALLENIDTVFWIIEDGYLPSAEDDEADLLQQLSTDLRTAALALSELREAGPRPGVPELAEAHGRLLTLQQKLDDIIRSAGRYSA